MAQMEHVPTMKTGNPRLHSMPISRVKCSLWKLLKSTRRRCERIGMLTIFSLMGLVHDCNSQGMLRVFTPCHPALGFRKGDGACGSSEGSCSPSSLQNHRGRGDGGQGESEVGAVCLKSLLTRRNGSMMMLRSRISIANWWSVVCVCQYVIRTGVDMFGGLAISCDLTLAVYPRRRTPGIIGVINGFLQGLTLREVGCLTGLLLACGEHVARRDQHTVRTCCRISASHPLSRSLRRFVWRTFEGMFSGCPPDVTNPFLAFAGHFLLPGNRSEEGVPHSDAADA